jgi:hypothetical protein
MQSPIDEGVANAAQWQAYRDTRKVAALLREEPLLKIDETKIEEKLKDIIGEYFEQNRPKVGGPPSLQESERLLSVCKSAYWNYFNRNISEEKVHLIKTSEEIQLRKIALEDRRTYPTYASRELHQRDIAIIRVLSLLNVSPLEHLDDMPLLKIHELADKYERYFSNPREEGIWPGPDYFRES